MIEKNYGILNFNFIDKIIIKKRIDDVENLRGKYRKNYATKYA